MTPTERAAQKAVDTAREVGRVSALAMVIVLALWTIGAGAGVVAVGFCMVVGC